MSCSREWRMLEKKRQRVRVARSGEAAAEGGGRRAEERNRHVDTGGPALACGWWERMLICLPCRTTWPLPSNLQRTCDGLVVLCSFKELIPQTPTHTEW